MGFFKKLVEGEDLEEHKEFKSEVDEISEENLEKLYLKLYMKIGRDFVHRGDYERTIQEMVDALDLEDEDISLYLSEEALALAYDYKDIIDGIKIGRYEDLIDLSE